MRKLIIPAVATAALAVSAFTYAAEPTTGTIVSIDKKLHTITLDDDTVYRLPDNYRNPALKEHEQVAVTWSMHANDRIASDVEILGYNGY
jgi:hypothetical protein